MYLLRCGDGSLYCGYAVDVERRLAQHIAGKGARYTRGRGPLELLAIFEFDTRSDAQRGEHLIKQLPRQDKLALAGQAT